MKRGGIDIMSPAGALNEIIAAQAMSVALDVRARLLNEVSMTCIRHLDINSCSFLIQVSVSVMSNPVILYTIHDKRQWQVLLVTGSLGLPFNFTNA